MADNKLGVALALTWAPKPQPDLSQARGLEMELQRLWDLAALPINPLFILSNKFKCNCSSLPFMTDMWATCVLTKCNVLHFSNMLPSCFCTLKRKNRDDAALLCNAATHTVALCITICFQSWLTTDHAGAHDLVYGSDASSYEKWQRQ